MFFLIFPEISISEEQTKWKKGNVKYIFIETNFVLGESLIFNSFETFLSRLQLHKFFLPSENFNDFGKAFWNKPLPKLTWRDRKCVPKSEISKDFSFYGERKKTKSIEKIAGQGTLGPSRDRLFSWTPWCLLNINNFSEGLEVYFYFQFVFST